MSYVISRIEPAAPSGIVYWTGHINIAADGSHVEAIAGTGFNSSGRALVVPDGPTAHGLALWLNSLPIVACLARQSQWHANPLTSHDGAA